MAKPTSNEVDEVLNQCIEQTINGGSKFPAMTFEEGVEAAIRWMQGDGDNPLE